MKTCRFRNLRRFEFTTLPKMNGVRKTDEGVKLLQSGLLCGSTRYIISHLHIYAEAVSKCGGTTRPIAGWFTFEYGRGITEGV
jgi:hypothetical protein